MLRQFPGFVVLAVSKTLLDEIRSYGQAFVDQVSAVNTSHGARFVIDSTEHTTGSLLYRFMRGVICQNEYTGINPGSVMVLLTDHEDIDDSLHMDVQNLTDASLEFAASLPNAPRRRQELLANKLVEYASSSMFVPYADVEEQTLSLLQERIGMALRTNNIFAETILRTVQTQLETLSRTHNKLDTYHNHHHTVCMVQSALTDRSDLSRQSLALVAACAFHDALHSLGRVTDSANVGNAIYAASYKLTDAFEQAGLYGNSTESNSSKAARCDSFVSYVAELIFATRYPFIDFVPSDPHNSEWKMIRDFDLTQPLRSSWLYQVIGLFKELAVHDEAIGAKLYNIKFDMATGALSAIELLESHLAFVESVKYFDHSTSFLHSVETIGVARKRHMLVVAEMLKALRSHVTYETNHEAT